MAAGTVPTPSVANGAAAVAALAAGEVVLFILDGETNRSRNFLPLTEELGGVPAAGTLANTVYPSVKSITEVTDPAGSGQVGQVKIVLTPGSTDMINASSAMSFVLDSNVVVGHVPAATTF